MGSGPPPPWIFLPLLFVTWQLLVFVHELGHAAAALALRPGRRVWVVVGRHPHRGPHPYPTRWVVLGRLAIAFNPMPALRRIAGICVYEPPVMRTERALIAFAGPAADLAAGLVTWNGLMRVDPGLLHDVLWVTTFSFLIKAVVNLLPFSSTDSGGIRSPSDGAVIIGALR
jgi:hypothetical protein